MSPQPLGQIGRYQLLAELGEGGMGTVYRAQDPQSQVPVALKLMTCGDQRDRKRFLHEARVLASLTHPNLPAVFDVGEHRGAPYLAMELIEGEDLDAAASKKPPLAWRVGVLAQAARVLEHCHAEGIVHRDVKPENIMIERPSERVLLVDFGIVKRDPRQLPMESFDRSRLTLSGEIIGTPAFMAPEQIDPTSFGEVSPSVDIYALGATLYFLLSGRAPFRGASVLSLLSQVANNVPDPLPQRIPVQLVELCQRCLEKVPAQRPASAGEVAAALEAWVGAQRQRRRQGVSKPTLVAVNLLLAGSLGLGGWLAFSNRDASETAAEAHASSQTRSQTLREQAKALWKRGDSEGAIELYDRALAIDPNDPWCWTDRGFVHYHRGDLGRARDDFNRALALDPKHHRAWQNRGAVNQAEGKLQQAVDDYSKALELSPDTAQVWNNRGALHLDLKDYEAALSDTSRAIELKPTLAEAWLNRSLSHHSLGDLEAALSDLNRCLELAPDKVEAVVSRAELYTLLGEPAEAIEDFTRALELTPKDSLLHARRGHMRTLSGDPAGGERDYDRAIDLYPIAPYYAGRGYARFRQGALLLAIADYDEALALDPELASSWINRGLARAKLGDFAGAIPDLERGLRLQPDLPQREHVESTLATCKERVRQPR